MSGPSNDADIKLAQLQAVFAKAVDMTFGEIGPSDLNDCFGSTREKLGASHVDGSFVRNLGKSRDRLEVNLIDYSVLLLILFKKVEFLELLEKHNMRTQLENASNQERLAS